MVLVTGVGELPPRGTRRINRGEEVGGISRQDGGDSEGGNGSSTKSKESGLQRKGRDGETRTIYRSTRKDKAKIFEQGKWR